MQNKDPTLPTPPYYAQPLFLLFLPWVVPLLSYASTQLWSCWARQAPHNPYPIQGVRIGHQQMGCHLLLVPMLWSAACFGDTVIVFKTGPSVPATAVPYPLQPPQLF